MNDRPTKVIDLPSGKQAELKSYITAREYTALRDEMYKDVRMDADPTGEMHVKDLTGESIIKMERKAIEMVLVSYDGSTENCMERLLDGTPADYNFVVKEANEVTKGNFNQAK